jgi:hypothetical protein
MDDIFSVTEVWMISLGTLLLRTYLILFWLNRSEICVLMRSRTKLYQILLSIRACVTDSYSVAHPQTGGPRLVSSPRLHVHYIHSYSHYQEICMNHSNGGLLQTWQLTFGSEQRQIIPPGSERLFVSQEELYSIKLN